MSKPHPISRPERLLAAIDNARHAVTSASVIRGPEFDDLQRLLLAAHVKLSAAYRIALCEADAAEEASQ